MDDPTAGDPAAATPSRRGLMAALTASVLVGSGLTLAGCTDDDPTPSMTSSMPKNPGPPIVALDRIVFHEGWASIENQPNAPSTVTITETKAEQVLEGGNDPDVSKTVDIDDQTWLEVLRRVNAYFENRTPGGGCTGGDWVRLTGSREGTTVFDATSECAPSQSMDAMREAVKPVLDLF